MKKSNFLVLFVFLLGIFMGAIDNSVVSPARVIIEKSLGVSSKTGIWMITIYTLIYAVSMPIVSKLSDLYGRKKIYLFSIITFTIGSVLCGITNFYGSFTFLLIARVIQAIGGGGIIPIATAYIGELFPPEKRGSALGIIGAVFGIATVIGPTIGSVILNIAGAENWGWIFFINVPICIIIVSLSYVLNETHVKSTGRLDLKGCFVGAAVILSLMYGLTNIDFGNFYNSLKNIHVWPFLTGFLVLLPLFIYIENRAELPILNFKYFTNRDISLTLAISFIVGVGMMAVIFIPQFAENSLKLHSGSGGYIVTLMAIFSGITAPLGGKLIDKYSAKLVLVLGFMTTIIGMSIFGFWTANNPNFYSILAGVIFIGFGMGFTMGTPLNYLMLSYVDENEASGAISTLSLVRSIGITISPNIMINFIATAGKETGVKLQEVLNSVNSKVLPVISQGKSGNIPNQSQMPAELMNSDITNVVDNIKHFSINMFNSVPSTVPKEIVESLKNIYINSIEGMRMTIESTYQITLNHGFGKMFITSGIIAIAGLMMTVLLKNKSRA